MNLENIKGITYEKKTRLPLLRNRDWGKVMAELNKLIYAGAKLIYEKIEVPLPTTTKKKKEKKENTNRNSKFGWEIRLETQIRNLRQQKKKNC